MKTDEEWLRLFTEAQRHRVMRSTPCLEDIRQIQADALRWAANLSGPLHRKTVLDKADELDPPAKRKPL